ncbi:DJ-1 family glyoxalase III [Clostridium perfringens]|uniref:DJ-1 family glyoxalase III n=1 Tax=Clostridium perfringens TaxID=1502 RepID=UPI0034A13870
MKKVLVFLAEGFETIEALSVVDVCNRAKVTCHACSLTENRTVNSAHGTMVLCDKLISDNDLETYDAIVLPGGMPGSTNLRDNEKVQSLIKKYNKENKIVAAICAAPISLAKAGVIEGKKVTSYPGFKEELGNVSYVEEDTVVVDGNIITSRGPATALVFGLEILKKLGYEKEAEEIREGMLINFFLEKEGK